MIWTEVAIRAPRARLDAVTARVLAFVPAGCAEVGRGPGARRTLMAYLPLGREGGRVLTRLRADLARVCPACTVRTRPVSDASWKDAWKAHARPVRVGRLAVIPTWWREREASTRTIVRVDAGQAFGSGEHASTQLCLKAVSDYVRAGTRVIDVGTGSGVLAIASAALGAVRVVAVDNDPIAVKVARANSRYNGVAARIRVVAGDGLHRVRERADLIIANLTADALPAVLPGVCARLRVGGRFVGAGFTTARLGEVTRLVRAAGLSVTALPARRGWRAVHAVRVGRRARSR